MRKNLINCKATNGTVQLVGREPEETVAIISFANIVDLIMVSRKQPKTLGEALDEIGFKPLGHRIDVRQGSDRK